MINLTFWFSCKYMARTMQRGLFQIVLRFYIRSLILVNGNMCNLSNVCLVLLLQCSHDVVAQP